MGVGRELNLVLVAVHLVCVLLQTVTVERLSCTPSGEHRHLPQCGWECLHWTEAASCTRWAPEGPTDVFWAHGPCQALGWGWGTGGNRGILGA